MEIKFCELLDNRVQSTNKKNEINNKVISPLSIILSLSNSTKNKKPARFIETAGKLIPIIDTSKKSLSEISVKAFGAVGDGRHDDIVAFETARDYVIIHPAILVVPSGLYQPRHCFCNMS